MITKTSQFSPICTRRWFISKNILLYL